MTAAPSSRARAAAGGSTAGLGAASGAPATGGSEAAPESASVEVSAGTSSAEAPAEGQDGVTAEAAKASNPYQQAIDASQARINEQARRSSERQADRDTMALIRAASRLTSSMVSRSA